MRQSISDEAVHDDFGSFYQQHVEPYLQNPELIINQDKITPILMSLNQPPQNLIESSSKDELSLYEMFLNRFLVDKPTDKYIQGYLHMISFLREAQFEKIFIRFKETVSLDQSKYLCNGIPRYNCSFIYMGNLLKNEDTFLIAFQNIIISFNDIKPEILQFIIKCFRDAIQNKIFVYGFYQMIQILFEGNHPSMEAIDIFFSAFLDFYPSITMQYLYSSTHIDVFSHLPCNDDLPISLLRFILKTEIDFGITLSTTQLWSYIIRSPALIFEFLDKFIKDEYEIWKNILVYIGNYNQNKKLTTDAQLNVLYTFFSTCLQHPVLITLFAECKLDIIIISIVKLIHTKQGASDKVLAFFAIHLAFCRLYDQISQITNDNSVEYSAYIQSIITEKTPFDKIIKYYLWILHPTSEFPFPSLAKIDQEFLNDFPSSYKFTHEINFNIMSLILDIGITYHSNDQVFKDFLTEIIRLHQERKYSQLFLGITNEHILGRIVPLALEDDLYFQFISIALSLSCTYSIFKELFMKLSDDQAKMIRFINILASNSPLVNEYLFIDKPLGLKISSTWSHILLWARFYKKHDQVITLLAQKAKLIVRRMNQEFYFYINNDKIGSITMRDTIEGWYHIHVGIDKKMIRIGINMNYVTIRFDTSSLAAIIIGGENSAFDLQSVRVFDSSFTNTNEATMFALGPNYKKNIVFDYLSIVEQNSLFNKEPLFATGKGLYISSLYTKWEKCFRNYENDDIHRLNYKLICSIEPPFNDLCYNKNSKPIEYANKSTVAFMSFINSLEAHGGIFYIIHLLAEIILKKKENQEAAFGLFKVLVNRYPAFHHFFVRNNVYSLIGQLLHVASVDPKVICNCAMVILDDGCLLTNVDIVEYWFLGSSLFHCEHTDVIVSILTSLKGEYAEANLILLDQAQAYKNIVKSISNSRHHTENFLHLLNALAMKLTNNENAPQHGEMVYKNILKYHFEQKEDNSSTITLVNLLSNIFSNYKVNLDFYKLLPAIIKNAPINQIALFDLFIKHLPEKYYHYFYLTMQNFEANPTLSENIYLTAKNEIAQSTHNRPVSFKYIIIPLLYFQLHNITDRFKEICSLAIPVLSHIKIIPNPIYEQVVFLIYHTNNKQDLVPVNLNKEEEFLLSPFAEFLTNFMFYSIIYKNGGMIFTKFLFYFYAIDENEYGAIVVLLIGRILEMIKNNLKEKMIDDLTIIESIIASCQFLPFVMQTRLTDLTNESVFLLRNALGIITLKDNLEATNRFIKELLKVADINLTIAAQILEDVQQSDAIYRSQMYNELIDKLESPASFPVYTTKTNTIQLKFRRDVYSYFQDPNLKEKRDRHFFLNLYCQAISEQTKLLEDVYSSQQSNDSVLEIWKKVFNSLYIPGSGVFDKCPPKYKVLDNTIDIMLRMILMPINPGLDRLYFDNWEQKYQTKPPEVRLTFDEIVKIIPFTYSHANDILFTGAADQLEGIRMSHGNFIVTKESIKFYKSDMCSTFFFDEIDEVRLTRFQHQPRGIIMIDINKNAYNYAFETIGQRESFVEIIEKFCKVSKMFDANYLQKITSQWVIGELSNFDYLMYLNQLSGRMWCDYTQFPIFPWVVFDYENEKPNNYRNLGYPIFAQTKEQQKSCLDYFQLTKDMGETPHHFSNYISNVGSALYFLVRLEPFTNAEIEFQGGSLDASDRTFQSFSITSEVMTLSGTKSALELVPEIYFMPEFLVNVNNVCFPKSPINKYDISHVVLPKWGKTPHKFVKKMRKILESPIVSQHLNEWIDLIWGVRSVGKPAFDRYNILQSIIFQFNPDAYEGDIKMMTAILDQIHNCGQAPTQLFQAFHPKRKVYQRKLSLKLIFEVEKRIEFMDSKRLSSNWLNVLGIQVRINFQSIEMRSSTTRESRFFRFSEEMAPTSISVSGNQFLTAHKIPILNHWRFKKDNSFDTISLRGALSKITSCYLCHECHIALAGHEDGQISTFCLNPHRFLRSFKCPESFDPDRKNKNCEISMLRVAKSTSNIFAFQNRGLRCTVTLFSVNGETLFVNSYNHKIVDCVITSYKEGTKQNIAFFLTSDAKLLLVHTLSLDKIELVDLYNIDHKTDYIALSLYQSAFLFCYRQNRDVLCAKLRFTDSKKDNNDFIVNFGGRRGSSPLPNRK